MTDEDKLNQKIDTAIYLLEKARKTALKDEWYVEHKLTINHESLRRTRIIVNDVLKWED